MGLELKKCRWYRWCTFTCEYLRKFSKKCETDLVGYSEAGGKLIHEKTRSKKSRDTVPLQYRCPLLVDEFPIFFLFHIRIIQSFCTVRVLVVFRIFNSLVLKFKKKLFRNEYFYKNYLLIINYFCRDEGRKTFVNYLRTFRQGSFRTCSKNS